MQVRPPRHQCFDAVVVGSGQIGWPLALALARAGLRTVLVDPPSDVDPGGGDATSEMARGLPRALPMSLPEPGKVHRRRHAGRRPFTDFGRGRILQATAGLEGLASVQGEVCFDGPRSLLVRGRDNSLQRFEAPNIFINTGARATLPQVPGLSGIDYLTANDARALDEPPADLLVLGGSYPGVELAQRFRRLGARVTIVEKRSQLLPREDRDIAAAVAESLRADGIEVFLESEAIGITGAGEGRASLRVRTPLGDRTLSGARLLVAPGQEPNTAGLDLPAAGIEVDAAGFIKVNERLETSVQGVYALGVVNGGPAFDEVAYDDFRVIRTNLIERAHAGPTRRIWPYLALMHPQLGRIGLTESQARQQGRDIKVAKLPMNSVARAMELSGTRGLMKVMVDSASRRILGAAVLGTESREIVAILQIAMMADMPYTALRDSMSAHPALSGTLDSLFAAFRT